MNYIISEPFICPYHNCTTDNGWCWECAVETYGYDKAQEIYAKQQNTTTK